MDAISVGIQSGRSKKWSPPLTGIKVPKLEMKYSDLIEKETDMNSTVIGIDIAKHVFHVIGLNQARVVTQVSEVT